MPQDRFRLDGLIALVSGAGSSASGWSNGKASSVLLARHGATVIAVDRDQAKAEETAALIHEEGFRAFAHAADATSPEDAATLAAQTRERYGRLDILVNNVGGSAPGDCLTMPRATWQAQLDLNLTSAFLMTQALLPLMLEQPQCAVVNIGSIAGRRYLGRDNIAYAAAKAGLVEFTHQTALRYAQQGLRCNIVVGGLLDTPLVSRIADQYGGGRLEAVRSARNAQIPIGRMGDAWDLAYAVLYLASPASSHVTATELIVDGGMSAATIPFRPDFH